MQPFFFCSGLDETIGCIADGCKHGDTTSITNIKIEPTFLSQNDYR